MNQGNRAFADLYDGALGRTLRIGVPSWRDLMRLAECIDHLSKGSILEVDLANDLSFALSNVTSVRLLVGTPATTKGGEIVFTAFAGQQHLTWTNTRAGWELCVGLIRGFSEEKPGHQYLSRERVDAALVELSYLGG